MTCCKKCGKELSGDEIGLTKKLVGKGEKEFLCIDCLASLFGCEVSLLEKKIEYYRSYGCRLFSNKE